jgi:hypothetical protein
LHHQLPTKICYGRPDRETIQELPVAIITHVMRKKPSASNPRQPRPLRVRFLPSWNSKSCGGVMLSSPRPPTRAIAANHITHWRNVALTAALCARDRLRSTGFQTADDPGVQGLIIGLGAFGYRAEHLFFQAPCLNNLGHAAWKTLGGRRRFCWLTPRKSTSYSCPAQSCDRGEYAPKSLRGVVESDQISLGSVRGPKFNACLGLLSIARERARCRPEAFQLAAERMSPVGHWPSFRSGLAR